jgi:hypothetical protein
VESSKAALARQRPILECYSGARRPTAAVSVVTARSHSAHRRRTVRARRTACASRRTVRAARRTVRAARRTARVARRTVCAARRTACAARRRVRATRRTVCVARRTVCAARRAACAARRTVCATRHTSARGRITVCATQFTARTGQFTMRADREREGSIHVGTPPPAADATPPRAGGVTSGGCPRPPGGEAAFVMASEESLLDGSTRCVTPSGSEGRWVGGAHHHVARATPPNRPLAPAANETPLIRASRTFSRREKALDHTTSCLPPCAETGRGWPRRVRGCHQRIGGGGRESKAWPHHSSVRQGQFGP